MTVADLQGDDVVERTSASVRLVMPDGLDVPQDARFTCRGPDLHVLVHGAWYRTDLDALISSP